MFAIPIVPPGYGDVVQITDATSVSPTVSTFLTDGTYSNYTLIFPAA